METVTVPKKDWDTMVSNVQEIKLALAGSKELDTTGLIHQVKIHDKIIQDYVATKNQGKGAAWILGLSWLGLTALISYLTSKLHNL